MSAPEALRRLAEVRAQQQKAEKPYSGPSRVWTGPRSKYVENVLRSKWETYGGELLRKAGAPGDPSAQ